MKFKKAGAAIIAATLTVTGAGYAWADENLFNPTEEQVETTTEETTDVTIPENETSATDDTTEENGTKTTEETETTEESTTTENEETDETETTEESTTIKEEETTKESEFPAIPAGYTAGNLIALKQAYENAGNDTAKAAILRNAKRAIAKFEAKQASSKQETTETEVIDLKPFLENTETQTQTTEKQVEPAPVVKTKESVKAEQKALKEEHKQEKKALKEEHKSEKQALKAEHKSEKQAAKGKE